MQQTGGRAVLDSQLCAAAKHTKEAISKTTGFNHSPRMIGMQKNPGNGTERERAACYLTPQCYSMFGGTVTPLKINPFQTDWIRILCKRS